MNGDKKSAGADKRQGTPQPAVKPNALVPAVPAGKTVIPPMCRRIDWLAFAVTTLLAFIGYYLTLAPELTLEDSGELAVGSLYAGVPHPPGYPLWTVYTWLFAKIIPFGNIAWRVEIGVALSGALSAGLIALITSRGSSMIIESIADFKGISRRIENGICLVSGFVAGALLAFNGYMWSQAVIVEVYPFSVLSLVGVICCLLRFAYAPSQRRYAYFAWFLFGICFTNHQTLLLGAMGIQVAILMAQPRLGRDMLLVNSIVFVIGLFALKLVLVGTFDLSQIVWILYWVVGILSIAGCIWLVIVTRKLGTEIVPVLIMFSLWVAGAAFYFYMPLTSMSNPPMNWGYSRTLDGFKHALTRGQYEKPNPTNFIEDPLRLLNQIVMYFEGAVEEFNWVTLLIAIIPFLFILRMQKRERGWLVGLAAIWFCLAFVLLIMLNPSPDRASRSLNRVFYTASYSVVSIFIGYGLTVAAAFMATQYQRFRFWGLVGGGAAVVLAMVSILTAAEPFFNQSPRASTLGELFRVVKHSFDPDQYGLPVHAGLLLLAVVLALVTMIAVCGTRIRMAPVLVLFALLPLHSVMSHWADNEQRNHWFGYWFGHDMFTPPFTGPDGRLTYDPQLREQATRGTNGSMVYPEMTRDAILFGGTDPGRFCPTYMIFCESFTPHDQQPEQDQNFDRRDVYIITQNALADGTYLEYIRAHYFRSDQYQYDTPFFQDIARRVFGGSNEIKNNFKTNMVAQLAYKLLDRPFINLGAKIEKRRRDEKVYPPKEIHTPTVQEHEKQTTDYMNDVQRRVQHDRDPRFNHEPRQLRGEIITELPGGRFSVGGHISVMSINGLLTKVIFDANPTNEFFVEESFPLDWMFPHLTPFSVIMKINREPLAGLSEEVLRRDHEFWSAYSDRLIGNWITYDTPMKEIAEFSERVHLKRNFEGFKGDPKFIRDDQAQKSFSKLRSSIAGVYTWRLGMLGGVPTPPQYMATGPERARIIKEADFALRQALAYCPHSMEAVYRYVQLTANEEVRRYEDALLAAETCFKFDPHNQSVANLVKQIKDIIAAQPANAQQLAGLAQLEKQVQDNPTNMQAALALASTYFQVRQNDKGLQMVEHILTNTNSDASVIRPMLELYTRMNNFDKLEVAFNRLTGLEPDRAENWFNLAELQTIRGKSNEAMANLRRSLLESSNRLATNAQSPNLLENARTNPNFTPIRGMPEFQQLVPPK